MDAMKPRAYYNEIDPFCCQWLQNLMDAGLIMAGEIDSRSIEDVHPDDVRGVCRVHFFAGIAGWDYALQLAGWPDDQPVWTGSCPCQPFSVAGKGRGTEDERHLWPVMHRLIAECHPATVFGEQVASAAGRDWLAGVRTDLEALAYAVGGADLCAAGVAAPHIRQRLYWVAYTDRDTGRWNARAAPSAETESRGRGGEDGHKRHGLGDGGATQRLADAGCSGPFPATHAGIYRREEGAGSRHEQPERHGTTQRLGDASGSGQSQGNASQQPSEYSAASHWSRAMGHECGDGKVRRIEPEIFPLAHGVPNRVGILRGAGNAIVPQVAATFIEAFMECRP